LINTPKENYSVLAQGMQYFSTYKEVPAIGDKFYSFNGTVADFGTYTGQLNTLHQLNQAIQAPQFTNERALVRILRVYTFHQLTDAAGDIPYFDAMKGEEGVLSPKYDPQRDIYLDMFKELEQAAAALDPSKTNFGAADLFYKGDVNKWKKFAYTLMLRLGMRLTKVEPELARTWVQKAIAGGVITTDADMAKISYANVTGGMNPKVRNSLLNGNYLNPQDVDNVEGGKYAATFIDKLKSTNDPRLPVISVVWEKPAGATSYVPNNSPAIQKGMISGSLNTRPLNFDTYSEPSPLVLNVAAPVIILGPAEAHLLLAEAALRGWYSGSTARASYENGVRAGMTQWAQWPAVAPSSNIITPCTDRRLPRRQPIPCCRHFRTAASADLRAEVAVYVWRRLRGLVELETHGLSCSGAGKLPRKCNRWQDVQAFFSIPISENLTNQTNYLEALKRQGFSESTNDNLVTRVWWDRP
jgi:hypothetical protein